MNINYIPESETIENNSYFIFDKKNSNQSYVTQKTNISNLTQKVAGGLSSEIGKNISADISKNISADILKNITTSSFNEVSQISGDSYLFVDQKQNDGSYKMSKVSFGSLQNQIGGGSGYSGGMFLDYTRLSAVNLRYSSTSSRIPDISILLSSNSRIIIGNCVKHVSSERYITYDWLRDNYGLVNENMSPNSEILPETIITLNANEFNHTTYYYPCNYGQGLSRYYNTFQERQIILSNLFYYKSGYNEETIILHDTLYYIDLPKNTVIYCRSLFNNHNNSSYIYQTQANLSIIPFL